MMLFAAALAVTTPVLNGQMIPTGERCFTIGRAGPSGFQPFGTMRQTVQRRNHDGVDALEIATHQQITNARGTINLHDVYLVRRSDLRPISYRSMMGGKTTVALQYTPDGVTGTKDHEGQAVAIDQRFERPTWDGNMWGAIMGALPIEAGGTYNVPAYHYRNGLGAFTFKVVGEQMVETPAGPAAAWAIEAYQDPARVARYFISKATRQELGYQAMGITQSPSTQCPTPV